MSSKTPFGLEVVMWVDCLGKPVEIMESRNKSEMKKSEHQNQAELNSNPPKPYRVLNKSQLTFLRLCFLISIVVTSDY